jgi:hypothetical protein
MCEISNGGAVLIVDKAAPEQGFRRLFALTTSKRGCEVVWRRGRSVGVRFLQQ